MSFNDIRRISYERLMQRTKTDRPYKDSGNAYPLGDRRYSDRHFRHEADGTFTIWYADREIVDNKYDKNNDKQDAYSQNKNFYDKRMIGRVHPDNSFEFVEETSQGENMLLTEALGAWVHHEKAKGGTVFEKRKVANSGKYIHPVFKGLRIDCDTGAAVTPYSVFLPVVNRKAANEVMSQYQDFITTFKVMIDSMDERGIWEVFEDLYRHEAGGDKDKWRSLNTGTVKRFIDEKKYVDAGCLFALLNSSSYMRWRVEWVMDNDTQSGLDSLSHRFKDNAKKDVSTKFRKMILKQHPEVFTFTELEAGDPLPASQWGVEVRVGNQPVARL